jgi:hypothetical protein
MSHPESCCRKCGAKRRLTVHHILPRVFFGERHEKITLCCRCHRISELLIAGAELVKGNMPYGQRFRMTDWDYRDIVRRYTHKPL